MRPPGMDHDAFIAALKGLEAKGFIKVYRWPLHEHDSFSIRVLKHPDGSPVLAPCFLCACTCATSICAECALDLANAGLSEQDLPDPDASQEQLIEWSEKHQELLASVPKLPLS